jgi:hypothetical protein
MPAVVTPKTARKSVPYDGRPMPTLFGSTHHSLATFRKKGARPESFC